MTKTFNFYTKNNNNTFRNIESTNYSKILDNIIATDIIDKNKYLFDNTVDNILDSIFDKPVILNSSTLKASDDFTKAATFLANYNKYKKTCKLPYIIGKMYTLSDGTPIVFYDDEVQIGFDVFKYNDFTNTIILNNLKPKTKKIIIDIYTSGTANIKINLL